VLKNVPCFFALQIIEDQIMTNIEYRKEIINQIDRLNTEQQREVLNFVRFISTKCPIGVAGNKLLYASGTIEQDDLQIMSRAIEEECEQVNLDEW